MPFFSMTKAAAKPKTSVPLLFLTAGFLAACSGPILPLEYSLEFPEIPGYWRSVLGEPDWLVEWTNPKGVRESVLCTAATPPSLRVLDEWPSPVRAFPCWPGIKAGLFRPAGAIFPHDASGGRIRLSWRGGADTTFYQALEDAALSWLAAGKTPNPQRRPQFFDWPRFRQFMALDAAPEIRADPWLVNWKAAAESTISSSFRSTYIKAETRVPVEIPIPHDGPWLPVSPFRNVEQWTAGETVPMALGTEPDLWFCPGGLLAVSKNVRLWSPWEGAGE